MQGRHGGDAATILGALDHDMEFAFSHVGRMVDPAAVVTPSRLHVLAGMHHGDRLGLCRAAERR